MNIPVAPERKYISKDLRIDSWSEVLPYFEDLKNREITNLEELKRWLSDRSELESVLEEDMAWRYIKMNIDTTDKSLSDSFHFFVEEIEPKIAPYNDELNKKLVACTFLDSLKGKDYEIAIRKIKNDIELYREENIPLNTELNKESQKFGAISAKMSVEVDGKTLTMQQASKLLKLTDRKKREEVYNRMQTRRLQDKDTLNELFNHLIKLRHKVALNTGYSNYRDYMFDAMARFDYNKEDCFKFHEAIAEEIVPIISQFQKERKKELDLDVLKPWDLQVDTSGKEPLNPFDNGRELIDKAITCFRKVRPKFGDLLEVMNEMKHLDLDSKPGKAPGGFNYPLYEIGVPFIYMNAVGSLRDVVTMVHEGGHAIHSYLSKDLELVDFKSLTSEIAELASMSMELISMEHWEVFFEDQEELKRAKKEQLQQVLETLPWVAQIDKFQHWIYEKPNHTNEERTEYWKSLNDLFGGGVIDFNGQEDALANMWQKQLHLFEVPFYYIEYGMAQLGAIAVWKNYKENAEKALDAYESALKLGYTRPIDEIYQTADVKFDFSKEYVKELAQFVKSELAKLD